jgi:hypothetical protein
MIDPQAGAVQLMQLFDLCKGDPIEYALRLRAAWERHEMQTGIELSGYADDDERWAETVEEYVAQAHNDHDYVDLISGDPFAIDCFWTSHEQWRTVSTSPIKCERVK